jgi:uncharacterized coiled-coil protein SlyX
MKYVELVRKQDAELADLRQQLAEARIESLNCKVAHGTDLENIAAQLREASQQLAEARGKVTREVDRAHAHACKVIALEEQLAAQAAELATLRERLAAAERLVKEVEREVEKHPDCLREGTALAGALRACKACRKLIAAAWIPPSTKGEG